MAVRIEISRKEELRRLRQFEDPARREERLVREFATRFTALGFGSIGIDGVDVAALHGDQSTVPNAVATRQIWHAVLVKVSGGQRCRLRRVTSQHNRSSRLSLNRTRSCAAIANAAIRRSIVACLAITVRPTRLLLSWIDPPSSF